MSKHGYTIYEIEELGMEDGNFDKDNHMPYLSSYGSSVDVDDLEDEEREAYNNGYYNSTEDSNLFDDDDAKDEDEEESW